MAVADISKIEPQRTVELSYSAKHFSQLSDPWRQAASAYLETSEEIDRDVYSGVAITGLEQQAAAHLQAGPLADESALLTRFRSLLEFFTSHTRRLHQRRYLGHQVPPPIPVASFFEAMAQLTNQGMAIGEMGPSATAIEAAVVRELANRFFSRDTKFQAGGFATHGGSLGNLTALLAARQQLLPEVARSGMQQQHERSIILVNSDVHYCIARAAAIMGLGMENVWKIPVDAHRRMIVDDLRQKLSEAKARGACVLAVVATAGSTSTGAFDPLEDIAEVCRDAKVWLHVDAAHGGGIIFSPRRRQMLQGIEHADSIVIDAHKMFFTPALCTFVMFRSSAASFRTFQQDAPYLFDPENPGDAAYDGGLRTIECTKRAMALAVWGVWSLYGDCIFQELVDRAIDRTLEFAALIDKSNDFVVAYRPQCNILCFTYTDLPDTWSPVEKDQFQLQLRRRLVEQNAFYITSTKVGERAHLRVTLMNPLIDTSVLEGLLDALRGEALKMKAERLEVA